MKKNYAVDVIKHFISTFIIVFIFGAFISLEPNPLEWSGMGRFLLLTIPSWAAFRVLPHPRDINRGKNDV